MKKFFALFISILFSLPALANESVMLNISPSTGLKVPNTTSDIVKKANFRAEDDESYDDKVDYFEAEDIFDNKAGQIFSKFINDKAINNKLNTFTMEKF